MGFFSFRNKRPYATLVNAHVAKSEVMPVDSDLMSQARTLLEENTQHAVLDGKRYRFTVPSVTAYPFQWFWDSCFHAIVWTRLGDFTRAKDELRGFFRFQESSGFIPHVIFWNQQRVRRSPFHWHYLESPGRFTFLPWVQKPTHSAHIQPPLLAQAVERIIDASRDTAFLHETLPVLERYYRWLGEARDPDRDGLISLIAQFESGLDFSPAYDESIGVKPPVFRNLQLRARIPEFLNALLDHNLRRIFRFSPYHLEDVLVNSVYAQGLAALGRLAERMTRTNVSRETQQRALATQQWARREARRVRDALIARCYDANTGLFLNTVGAREEKHSVKTVISLMPLILPDLSRPIVEALVAHLLNPAEFWPLHPIPSVALDEPSFTQDNRVRRKRHIWRGALSMNINWFLVHGLRQHGYADAADRIAESSRNLVRRHGFNEFYSPLDGEPVGAERFGWATLVTDL